MNNVEIRQISHLKDDDLENGINEIEAEVFQREEKFFRFTMGEIPDISCRSQNGLCWLRDRPRVLDCIETGKKRAKERSNLDNIDRLKGRRTRKRTGDAPCTENRKTAKAIVFWQCKVTGIDIKHGDKKSIIKMAKERSNSDNIDRQRGRRSKKEINGHCPMHRKQ